MCSVRAVAAREGEGGCGGEGEGGCGGEGDGGGGGWGSARVVAGSAVGERAVAARTRAAVGSATEGAADLSAGISLFLSLDSTRSTTWSTCD